MESLPRIALLTLFFWYISYPTQAQAQQALIARPNCQSKCGDVDIPYPFGIGPGCYINDGWFQIICDNSTGPPRPFLNQTKLEVVAISIEKGTLQVMSPITFHNCSNKTNNRQATNLVESPFEYSQKNLFSAIGCGVKAMITSDSNGYTISSGCRSECGASANMSNVCQTALPSVLSGFETVLQVDENHKASSCNFGFLADRDWVRSQGIGSGNRTNTSSISEMESVPVVLEWHLYHSTFAVYGINFPVNASSGSTSSPFEPRCRRYNDSSAPSLVCSCGGGMEGNPYLLDSCHDINECELPDTKCLPPNICRNFINGYGCSPPESNKDKTKVVFIGLGSAFGFLFLLIVGWFLYKFIKKRRAIKRKQKFFKQNGGLLLEQQLSSGEVNVEKIKLFNAKELDKATDRFNVDRILGKGGQGTVYKGMLTDGRIVAVKKSNKLVDGGEVAEFINEIVILSQINHRNVVKLLGCCLETEVPLLVYEFIPKGTIYNYLHEENDEFLLSWEMRLRIAGEVAGALSYLHSAAGFPIYHRDIKSTNILLDDKYRAKIADFGTSRSVSIDQTHLTTVVHGTFGYLDPEYFVSSQFTDKSDVYSFGVVLLELLTGEKPVSLIRPQESRGLVTYFMFSMEENRLFDILDAQVKEEGVTGDIVRVSGLAQRCLDMSGKRRPTMKEVAMELEAVQKSVKAASNIQQSYEEVEYVRNEVPFPPLDITSTSTGSVLDGGTNSSKESLPLLSL